jgi:hypothetical protein
MKIFYFFSLFILATCFTNAQDTLNIYKLEKGTWNEVKKQWDWKSPSNDVVAQFILKDNTVFAENKTYYLGNLFMKRPKYKTWISEDENGAECTINIAKKKGINYFIVIHDDFCLRYSYH